MGLFDRFKKATVVPQAAPSPRPANVPCRRTAERFPTTVLTCLLGTVSDLSTTGMRVVSRQAPPVPPGTLFEFEIETPTNALTVVGKIVRAAKMPTGGFDVGIEFQRLTPELIASLDTLARCGKVSKRQGASSAGNAGPGVMASVNLPDLYTQLGIDASADDARIQQAYREMARRFHPDVNKTDGAHEKFVEISRAYEVLRDPDKRLAYDQARGARRNAA